MKPRATAFANLAQHARRAGTRPAARAGSSLTPRLQLAPCISSVGVLQRLWAGPTGHARIQRYATSTAEPPSQDDPTLKRALELIDEGTKEMEEGAIEAARACYQESVALKETSAGWFNLGVCEYHTKNRLKAIAAWEKSIKLEPSPDAYTNLASAYILAQPPDPAKAIKHLTSALELAPDDPEIAFNLAAILESTDNLDQALKLYQRAESGGISRAQQNIRNVAAKLLTRNGEAPAGP